MCIFFLVDVNFALQYKRYGLQCKKSLNNKQDHQDIKLTSKLISGISKIWAILCHIIWLQLSEGDNTAFDELMHIRIWKEWSNTHLVFKSGNLTKRDEKNMNQKMSRNSEALYKKYKSTFYGRKTFNKYLLT